MRRLFVLVLVMGSLPGYSQSAAGKYLETGKQEYGFQNYREAIFTLTKAIKKNPRLAEAYLYRGLAKKEFNHGRVGVCFNHKDPDRKYEMADLNPLSVPGTIASTQAGIEITCADALWNNPQDEVIFSRKENELIPAQGWSGEIADYNRAIELEPAFADAYYCRAMAYIRFGYRDMACQDLQMAKDLGRTDADAQMQVYCK